MALSALQVFAEARNVYGFSGTLEQVVTELDKIDRKPYEDAERARYRYEIWDEVSPIGGIPAQKWREQWAKNGEWPAGGKVLLLYVDGNLQLVQPHKPFSAGHVPMTEEEVHEIATQLIDQAVEAVVDAKVKEQVLYNLLMGR